MMEECVEDTSEVSSLLLWCRRLPMAPGSEPGNEPGSEPGPEAGEPSARTPGEAARRGGVARPSPESTAPRTLHTHTYYALTNPLPSYDVWT